MSLARIGIMSAVRKVARTKVTLLRFPINLIDGNGKSVVGIPEELPIKVDIQPAKPDELIAAPQGYRDDSTKSVITLSEIRTVSEDERTPADHIVKGNKTYLVIAVNDWSEQGGHYDGLITEVV